MTEIHRARAQFGERLRRLREEAGLNGKQLAETLGWAPSKVSKLETGKQTATSEDVRGWASAVQAAPQVLDDLLTDLRTVRFEYASWRRQLRAGTAPRQRVSGALEASAKTIRAFELDIVPGILQTPDYAREVLTRLVALRGVPDDVPEGVRSRLRRQEALYDSEKHFRFLLSEAALRSRPCPLPIYLAQLDRLIGLAGLDTVEIAVLRFNTELPVLTYGAYWIYDEALVLVETLTAELALRDPEDVALHASVFEQLWDVAVQGEAATDFIRELMVKLGGGRAA